MTRSELIQEISILLNKPLNEIKWISKLTLRELNGLKSSLEQRLKSLYSGSVKPLLGLPLEDKGIKPEDEQ